MSDFKKYKKVEHLEMRELEAFEIDRFAETGTLIFFEDNDHENLNPKKIFPQGKTPKLGDMVARDSNNHDLQWLITKKQFEENFEQQKTNDRIVGTTCVNMDQKDKSRSKLEEVSRKYLEDTDYKVGDGQSTKDNQDILSEYQKKAKYGPGGKIGRDSVGERLHTISKKNEIIDHWEKATLATIAKMSGLKNDENLRVISGVFQIPNGQSECQWQIIGTAVENSSMKIVSGITTKSDVRIIGENSVSVVGTLANGIIPVETLDKIMPKKGLDFGLAIVAAKAGKKIARVGWNGNGMFVYYVPAAAYTPMTEIGKEIAGLGVENKVQYREYLALKTAQGDVATWAPSGSDSLAEDWVILD